MLGVGFIQLVPNTLLNVSVDFPLHQAVLKSFLRICRCNPSHPGGNDPVLSEDTQPDQKICSK